MFHVSQVEGIEPKEVAPLTALEPIIEAERIKKEYKTRETIQIIETISDKAYYSPASDYIKVPCREQYPNIIEFYSTLFHEMVHSTGHKTRLARLSTGYNAMFGSETYNKQGRISGRDRKRIILTILGIETIEYCTNEGAVNSSGPGRVGGIVGEGNHVIQCNNTGTVKGVIYGAGIVCEGGIAVKNCYNTGSITGSFSLGGIIYSTLVEGFTLEKNYNSGEIGSTSSSGGILGYLKHDGGQIIDCHYHAGSAQKGIGTHPVNVSIEATGYVDSVVSADDPKTVPAMLAQSILLLVAQLLFWSKKKQQLLTQISKLISIKCVKFDTGVFDENNETLALQLDYLPLWLASVQTHNNILPVTGTFNIINLFVFT